jgi:uncharacterized MAPEG superfamily protein
MPTMILGTDVRILVSSTLLTWVMIIASSLMRTTFWKPSGMKVALGNRDDVPEPSPLAARADRAAKNMLENLLFFCCLILAARLANAPQDRVVLGARIFFCARVAYFPIYLARVTHLRTLVWSVSVVGMGIIGVAAL